ncbi:MAG TPA: ATP-dependent DNA helicase [Solirubrobacteraceae bacterium]|nr:ATP-dependent DNA helicase [Solirubrobacteraceae bacterium]
MRDDGLTGPQREAVEHPGPSLLIRGVAGAGKTRVIRERHLRLLAAGAHPERIAVLVPSVARAAALREQLQLRIDRGYEELIVVTPVELAARVLRGGVARGAGALDFGRGSRGGWPGPVLGPGDRLALLGERIDELSLRHHDLAGRPTALLGAFVRRIDRLKAELVDVERYRAWAASLDPETVPDAELQREFAEVYLDHERLLAEVGARDEGGLLLDALALAERRRGSAAPAFDHLLIDDAQELDRAASSLALALRAPSLTVAADPDAAVRRFRGAGAERVETFAALPGTHAVELAESLRCPPAVWRAAEAALGRRPARAPDLAPSAPAIELWRCSSERAEAQAVAVEIERLIARDGASPARIAVIVPDVTLEGQAIAGALEERAIAHRVIGEAAFFRRAEIRDVLAWLRLLSDPTDAAAVVRALARPPVELRSVDIARCTQIARRRKLDMIGALAAALQSPQVPPEARDRIRTFLSLYRSSLASLDSARPDLYVHRLIERLGLRRNQLFAAQADVAERLRALATFGELASEHLARAPLATPREFARSVSALAEVGLGRQEEPDLRAADVEAGRARCPAGGGEAPGGAVQVLAASQAGGLEADDVFVVGLDARSAARAPEPIPDALLSEPLPPDDEVTRERMLRQEIHVACTRARRRLVLAYPRADDRGEALEPAPVLREIRTALDVEWRDREEELFGPAEALHSTYRMLRDELLQGTTRAAGRIGELRLDTDLDISHAVVRYLELLKVAALIAQGEREGAPSVAESLRDINARILQAVTGEQREIFETSALDEYLLDAERGARARAQAVAARDEPSLEAFLPLRGEGVMLSASDIDTYRTCPLKYKFARVFRIPQEPTLHQRFGILIHQVLERYHAGADGGPDAPEQYPESQSTPGLPELLGLLDAGWRRGGFGDSLQERQLRGKAAAALTRYHERFRMEDGRPVWFERQFTFPIGPHLLRGRVDRVDRLPDGEYELIDYKTGRPKSAAQLADDVQLSLYAVGAREAWRLEASRQAYYYLLDDEKVAVPDDGDRAEWVREIATEVAEGIRGQGFEPTPSYAACSVCDYRLVCPAAER